MATIEKRISKATGKPSYRARVKVNGQTEASTHARKSEAVAWANKTEADMRARRHFGASKRHKFAELLDRYEASALPRLKSGPDVKAKLDWWRAEHGDKLLFDLTPDVIAQARDKLAATPKMRGGDARSAAAVNRTLAALSSACSYAVKELGWLERNPVERVSKMQEPKGRVRFLSKDEELPALLTACRASPNPNLYLAVLLALTTGARQAEVMGLRWPQIDLQARTATLEDTKNGEMRTLPLSREVVAILQERNKVRNLKDDRLFPPKAGSKSPFLDLRAPFAAAIEVAKLGKYEGEGKERKFIPNFRWHDLRHTAASYMMMNGISPLEIAKILGHRTMAMVARYSHLANDRVLAIGDMLADQITVGIEK